MRMLGLPKSCAPRKKRPARTKRRPSASPVPDVESDEDFEALLAESFATPALSDARPTDQPRVPTEPVFEPVEQDVADFADDDAMFAAAVANLSGPLHLRDELDEGSQHASPNPGDTRRTLDLHGLRRTEALHRLHIFVANAVSEGVREVLVITGRGLHSSGHAVLREATRDWLKRARVSTVVDFAKAPAGLGGEGAWLVTLRARR